MIDHRLLHVLCFLWGCPYSQQLYSDGAGKNGAKEGRVWDPRWEGRFWGVYP